MMARLRLLAVILVATFGLQGCFGVGMVAHTALGDKAGLGGKGTPPAETVAAAQEQALTAAHGGSPGASVAWSDAKSGMRGTLIQDTRGGSPDGCRRYRQTIVLGTQTVQGAVSACPQTDGTWKLRTAQADT